LIHAFEKAVTLADAEVAAGKHVLPPAPDVFAALLLTPLEKVRVVILGQDPYPTPGHAHGLAFSAGPGIKTMPASLRNIVTELRDDLGVEGPLRGDLTPWARQGVLLLNTVLTVEAGKAAAHMKWPWREAAKAAIAAVSRARPHVVFLLWGLKAQRFADLIDRERHLVVMSEHPSPLSAYRGFFGSKPFSRANAWLAAQGEEQIVWGEPAQSKGE
jgi:uracil-DNA glycosylase